MSFGLPEDRDALSGGRVVGGQCGRIDCGDQDEQREHSHWLGIWMPTAHDTITATKRSGQYATFDAFRLDGPAERGRRRRCDRRGPLVARET